MRPPPTINPWLRASPAADVSARQLSRHNWAPLRRWKLATGSSARPLRAQHSTACTACTIRTSSTCQALAGSPCLPVVLRNGRICTATRSLTCASLAEDTPPPAAA